MSTENKTEKALSEKPLPVIDNESRPFWEACREGRLMLQHCQDCGNWVFYPRALCTGCFSERLEWEQASGEGVIHTFTVCHRPAGAAFKGETPYVVALIDLKEGPRMMSNIVGTPHDAVRIGQSVRVTFEKATEAVTLPKFEVVP